MRITRNQLRQLIQEELVRINEDNVVWSPDNNRPVTVKRVFAKEGDSVRPGQRLAKVEDSNGQTEIVAWNPNQTPFGRYMPTTGEITQVHIEPGDTFEKGQVMFYIDVTERTGED